MYCNQGFKNLICSSRVNNKYLYFFSLLQNGILEFFRARGDL